MDLSRKLSSIIAPTAFLAKWKNAALRAVAVEPLASDEAERTLKYGDLISLFSVEHNGYISTDGYVMVSSNGPLSTGFGFRGTLWSSNLMLTSA